MPWIIIDLCHMLLSSYGLFLSIIGCAKFGFNTLNQNLTYAKGLYKLPHIPYKHTLHCLRVKAFKTLTWETWVELIIRKWIESWQGVHGLKDNVHIFKCKKLFSNSSVRTHRMVEAMKVKCVWLVDELWYGQGMHFPRLSCLVFLVHKAFFFVWVFDSHI